MKLIKPILIFLLFFLIVTFSIQNMGEVSIHYYGVIKELTLPFAIVLLVALFLGIIVGGIGGIVSNAKLRMELWKQKKEAEGVRKKLESLEGKKIKPKVRKVRSSPSPASVS
jgi:uncharacterized integral membrane protein